MPSGTLLKLNTTVLSGFKIGLTAQRGLGRNSANLFVGQGKFLSRNSGVSLSSAYSTNLLPKTNNYILNHSHKGRLMAASSSKPVFGEVYVDDLITSSGNSLDLVKPTGVFFGDKSHSSCKKNSVNFRRKESLNIKLTTGVLVANITTRTCNSNTIIGPWSGLMSPCTSSFMCYSAGAAHDVSFDGHSRDEHPAESAILSDQTVKLLSGSCYLPHPDKEETGGEDAHFICEDEQAIGVADGVGGWADVGINAGLFARELMSYSVSAIKQEPKGSLDPARVLEKAHSSTKAKGSSTACIIALTEKEADSWNLVVIDLLKETDDFLLGLHAINLGDSGFMVVRDGCTIFQSPVQQHGFNFTYQLESGTRGDLPSSGQVFTIPVVQGDIIIAGTDGLFDNLYNNEVTAIVVHAVRAGMEPRLTAQKIAALARQRALDKNRQTPFSAAAQEAGFRYYGGKLDDITVVVSYVTSSVDA